jgi:hypothetical protein
MIHSVLTGLPEFVDYGQVQDNAQNNTSPELAKAIPEHSNYILQPNEVTHSHSLTRSRSLTRQRMFWKLI